MYRICEARSPEQAERLARQLTARGISCHYDQPSVDVTNTDLLYITIWGHHIADRERTEAMLKYDFKSTELKWLKDKPPRCLACQYDLRTQSGTGKCPECGYPYGPDQFDERAGIDSLQSLPAMNCKHCDADISEGFELCWRCGTDRDGTVPDNFAPVVDSRSAAAEPPAGRISALLISLFIATTFAVIFAQISSGLMPEGDVGSVMLVTLPTLLIAIITYKLVCKAINTKTRDAP